MSRKFASEELLISQIADWKAYVAWGFNVLTMFSQF